MRQFLKKAADTPLDLGALIAAWQTTEITLLCAAFPQTDFALGGRVRGALGHQLKLGASDGALKRGVCDWAAPCGYDILFNAQGKITSRLEIPKPWALKCWPSAQGLHISLKLYGMAGNWAGEVADALVRAMRGGLSDGRRRRHKLAVLGRDISTYALAESLPNAPSPVMLEFETPLMLRQGNETHHHPASLLKSMANRVSGLARWHGAALQLDGQVLAQEADALACTAQWEGVENHSWASHSSRQQRSKPMHGVTGRLYFPAPSAEMRAMLALGASAQAGAHTTHGMGAFTVADFPNL